jgi:hypothetical protein
MPMEELFVYLEADVWVVQLGKYLLSTRTTQMEALEVARYRARDCKSRRQIKAHLEGCGRQSCPNSH